jgi:alpha-1,3-rhamnosyl/mannosyltransferase
MKVILTVDAVRPKLTGIGRYAYELGIRLPRQDRIEECRYFSRGIWVQDIGRLLEKAPVLPSGQGRRRWLISAVRWFYRLLAPLFQALSLLRSSGCLFHSTNFYLPPFRGKKVVTVHDLSVIRFPDFHPADRIAHLKREIPRVIHRADHLITDSDFVKREIIAFYGIPAERISTIHLAAGPDYRPRDGQECSSVLRKHGGLPYAGFSLFVSTIEPRKNVEGLLAAYRVLDPAFRRRWPLVVVGHKGWRSEAIHADMQRAQAEGWLFYLDYVPEPDMPILFAAAGVFVFPSWYEGFGLPVLQAMASGVPCVVSDSSCLQEVCGDAGLAVDPNDANAIASGIMKAAEDPLWRAAAREKGLERARRFSWDRCVHETVSVYEKVWNQQPQ